MISKTFINRPKFALVISIVITLAGLISLYLLPVNMYPQITPPQVQVTAVYPGASAQVVEESVIRPIEEKINGDIGKETHEIFSSSAISVKCMSRHVCCLYLGET